MSGDDITSANGLSVNRCQPSSAALYDRALACLPGGSTRSTVFAPPHPPYAVRGHGPELVDADGRVVLDLLANFTALVHGHAAPEVVRAATDAVAAGPSFGLPTAAEVDLAECLSRRQPSLERVRFTNSGTEAVMTAVRAARAFTGRPGVLVFSGSYHGMYDPVLPPRSAGVPEAVEGDVVRVPHGDQPAFERALERHGPRLACVLLDLMPNRAGLEPADPAFVRLVRQRTDDGGMLLVVDEVITFRLAYGGMQERYGLAPDLTVLGKVIGGGFPVGALGGRASVMDAFDPRLPGALPHSGTFVANPVTMRAGLAAMRLLDAPAIDRINALGDRLRAALRGSGFTVSGSGSLLRVLDIAGDPGLWRRLYEHGVLVARNGLASVCTPMTESTVELAVERFRRVRA